MPTRVVRDPDAKFTIREITRRGVANEFNDVLECHPEWKREIPEFRRDDSRLTDRVCRKIAKAKDSRGLDEDDEQDLMFDAVEELLRGMGYSLTEDDDDVEPGVAPDEDDTTYA